MKSRVVILLHWKRVWIVVTAPNIYYIVIGINYVVYSLCAMYSIHFDINDRRWTYINIERVFELSINLAMKIKKHISNYVYAFACSLQLTISICNQTPIMNILNTAIYVNIIYWDNNRWYKTVCTRETSFMYLFCMLEKVKVLNSKRL